MRIHYPSTVPCPATRNSTPVKLAHRAVRAGDGMGHGLNNPGNTAKPLCCWQSSPGWAVNGEGPVFTPLLLVAPFGCSADALQLHGTNEGRRASTCLVMLCLVLQVVVGLWCSGLPCGLTHRLDVLPCFVGRGYWLDRWWWAAGDWARCLSSMSHRRVCGSRSR